MADFITHGPFDISIIPTTPFETDNYQKGFIRNDSEYYKIDKNNFWNKYNIELKDQRGIYVFGIRTSMYIKPWYIGKTDATFSQEAFISDKIIKYHKVLSLYKKCTPVMFFLIPTIRTSKAIDEVETYLIQVAKDKNPDLINKMKRYETRSWEIPGVTYPTPGKNSNTINAFNNMMFCEFTSPVQRLVKAG